MTVTRKPRSKKIAAIKGMNRDLTCRGFQFAPGESYEVSGQIVACSNGFHSCPADNHPLSVFEYYAPGTSRYFEVEAAGGTDRQGNKIASAGITIGVEVSLGELTRRAIDWVFGQSEEGETATGDQGAASATGDQGAASATGYRGKVSGKKGCALFALEREESGKIISTASGIVGHGGLKPDTFYLCRGGKLVKV